MFYFHFFFVLRLAGFIFSLNFYDYQIVNNYYFSKFKLQPIINSNKTRFHYKLLTYFIYEKYYPDIIIFTKQNHLFFFLLFFHFIYIIPMFRTFFKLDGHFQLFFHSMFAFDYLRIVVMQFF